jgi:hypothetical protein
LNAGAAGVVAPSFGEPAVRDAGIAQDLSGRLAALDRAALRRRFLEQDEFLFIENFLPPELVRELQDAVRASRGSVNRNLIPGHKKGGSVSRHVIDRLAPVIAALYRRPEFMSLLAELSGEKLLPSPPDDAHAYALYFYTEAGDHIGWHYDTSYYKGCRYTVLLGVVDDSSCKLEYRLYTKAQGKERGRAPVAGAIGLKPGALVFFNGDKLHHRITPLAAGEDRVALTFEYVTSQDMHPFWRLISNMKDSIAYFGFRQVFRRSRRPT